MIDYPSRTNTQGHKTKALYRLTQRLKRNGGEHVAECLKSHGIKQLFTLCGNDISPILVASEKLGIRIVDTRHEATAVFAAEAVARLSGTIGVVVIPSGPCLTNTVTAVKNAQMAESPILLIGGAAKTLLKGRGAPSDFDQLKLFKSICKYSKGVQRVCDIVPTLRKAIQQAQSETPGPVFVELPEDILYPYQIVRQDLDELITGQGLWQTIVGWYLKYHLDRVFIGAWDQQDTSPLQVQHNEPTHAQVNHCIKLVTEAKKPLFIIGNQATRHPSAVNQLREALESLGIPCFLDEMTRGLLGRNSRIVMRDGRKEALMDADLVLLAGVVCDNRLDYNTVVKPSAKIIIVNTNKQHPYKVCDILWKYSATIHADVNSFIIQLSRGIIGKKVDSEWIQLLRHRDTGDEMVNSQTTDKQSVSRISEVDKEGCISVVKLLKTIDKIISKNSVIVVDGENFINTVPYFIRPRPGMSFLDPGPFMTPGCGAGFAIGAKLTYPDSEVWLICDDKALGCNMVEMDSLNRHACVNYHTTADGFGCKGICLDGDNQHMMEDLLRRAQLQCKQGSQC